ncbi:MAG: sensor histidine kinase, partial [Casimicrobiaceae bacterium]
APVAARGQRRSLRRRLLLFLVSILLLLVSTAAVITYRAAVGAANDAYDRSLLDPALELAKNIRTDRGPARLDLPPKAQEMLTFDQADEIVFQIRNPEGALVAGARDMTPPPPLMHGAHHYYDGRYKDRPIRVVALRAEGGYTVQVGETLGKRQRLVWEILAAELVPTLLIALASLALTWIGVEYALAPLHRIRRELLARTPQDLHPIRDVDAPEEIAPVLAAFNRVLSQLTEASASQKRFLANAAHQLRTPLAGLQMHLELLLRREPVGEAAAELARLHRATVRAGHVTTQLLALAKADGAAGGVVSLAPIDLYDVAATAARQWVPEAIARRLDLGFSLDHVTIAGDPLLLADMADNLIANALHYTPEEGSVTVRCGAREDGVPYLSVEDTGPGIPPAEREKVLERFYRVPGTGGDGSGLGLAIVKEVADRHHATLSITTPSIGHGALVRVTFPQWLEPANREAAAHPKDRLHPQMDGGAAQTL